MIEATRSVRLSPLRTEQTASVMGRSTDNLRARLAAHNAGQVPHTSKFKPWRINTYIGFNDETRAVEFEKYLKSPSGRAFATKRL